MKRSPMPPRRTPLGTDTEKVRAFAERGRQSSARSLSGGAGGKKKRVRRGGVSPASPQQRSMVAGMACLGCGVEASDYVSIDPAHLWPRGRGGCDGRFCVVPLCRRGAGEGCHREYDEGRLDLLERINAQWEQWRPWVQHALQHCNPVELVERLAGARTQWSDLGGEPNA